MNISTLPASERLVKLMELAFEADLPVLLEGRHGVGKSALLAEAARRLGVSLVVRDLSLMEPPDLAGLPALGLDGRTHYAVPAFLPTGGRGLLAFEELNRCPRYVLAPCLQLLTARRLNDYALPAGWLPVAAVNNAQDGYHVEELDEALTSRFLRVRVVADRSSWLCWARAEERVHAKVCAFVEHSPGVFDEAASNPRSWAYASNLLRAWERQPGRDQDLLAAGLAGLVGEKWALAFLQFYCDRRRPLTAAEIVEGYPAHRAALKAAVAATQLDVAAASLEALKRHLQPQRSYQAVVADRVMKKNVESFFGDLPADLRRQLRAWLSERGFDGLAVPGR